MGLFKDIKFPELPGSSRTSDKTDYVKSAEPQQSAKTETVLPAEPQQSAKTDTVLPVEPQQNAKTETVNTAEPEVTSNPEKDGLETRLKVAGDPVSSGTLSSATSFGTGFTNFSDSGADSNYYHNSIVDMLTIAMRKDASDIHLTVGLPPLYRIRGELVKISDKKLTMKDTMEYSRVIMPDIMRGILEEKGEADFSYAIPGVARYRVNIYKQRKSYAAAIRVIRPKIPTLEELGLPDILKDISLKKSGLFLVTGPTGSGKSTTLAAMMRYINENKNCHMITIEDPIEYVHQHGEAMVNQREVNDDTLSFSNALRAALREDPDVILVGEMRDFETISTAITASETGHFVMSTLHTSSAAQTIDRVIDVFPPHQQQQIRTQLASVIEGVLAQRLIRTADGSQRIAAIELMVANDAIRNIIREGKTYQINTVMQTGIKQDMIPMDYYIASLVKRNLLSYRQGMENAFDVEVFKRYMTTN
jgi:twitching motility protein PilT